MTLVADFEWPGMLAAAGIAAIIVVLLRRSRRYFTRQRKTQVDNPLVEMPRPPRVDAAHHADTPPEVVRWQVEMHDTARELSAEMDSKMRALQVLIAEADRASARLEAATAEARGEMVTPSSDGANPMEPAAEDVYTLADYGYPTEEIARRLGGSREEVRAVLKSRKAE